jgi:hypothetical protein
MGKSKQMKLLRKIAKQLPELITTQRAKITGEELIANGIKKIANGEEVKNSESYVGAKKVPLNHYKNLKRSYNKAKVKGAASYVNQVNRHVINLQKQAADAKAREEENKSTNKNQ